MREIFEKDEQVPHKEVIAHQANPAYNPTGHYEFALSYQLTEHEITSMIKYDRYPGDNYDEGFVAMRDFVKGVAPHMYLSSMPQDDSSGISLNQPQGLDSSLDYIEDEDEIRSHVARVKRKTKEKSVSSEIVKTPSQEVRMSQQHQENNPRGLVVIEPAQSIVPQECPTEIIQPHDPKMSMLPPNMSDSDESITLVYEEKTRKMLHIRKRTRTR